MKQTAATKRLNKFVLALLAGTCSLLAVTQVSAEACTYREAMMALERGNVDRGMALMRMASRDGDQRAVSFLREQDYARAVEVSDSVVVGIPTSMAGNQVDLK